MLSIYIVLIIILGGDKILIRTILPVLAKAFENVMFEQMAGYVTRHFIRDFDLVTS
jgi:hypothetical protein